MKTTTVWGDGLSHLGSTHPLRFTCRTFWHCTIPKCAFYTFYWWNQGSEWWSNLPQGSQLGKAELSFILGSDRLQASPHFSQKPSPEPWGLARGQAPGTPAWGRALWPRGAHLQRSRPALLTWHMRTRGSRNSAWQMAQMSPASVHCCPVARTP